MLTKVRSFQLSALNAQIAAMTTPKLRLFKNNFAPTQDSALADFTEADFSGYLASNISGGWGTPYVDPATGIYVANSVAHAFNSTATMPFVANTIYGYYIDDGVSVLYGFERFAAPVAIAAYPQGLSVYPSQSLVQ